MLCIILFLQNYKKVIIEEIELNQKVINLVSVGDLNYQKGFDIAIEACKVLVKSGYE